MYGETIGVQRVACAVAVLAATAIAVVRTDHRPTPEDTARRERQRLATRLRGEAAPDWFAEFRDVDELNVHMAMLGVRHPEVAHLRRIGSSIEERPIQALEISRGGTLAIVLDGGHHAREWISVMTPICIADRLANGYVDDPRIRRILGAVKFVIVPLVNPDGYHYSWTVDRFWRKSRRGGYGVDLNRNYAVGWGGADSSAIEQSPNYRGERAFSEPETRALRSVFEREPIAAHVDFHSFSQVITYPWSYQRARPKDEAKLHAIASLMRTAMQSATGLDYKVRPGNELQVGASGTAGDWSYGMHGALSFLIELRPSSRAEGGFVLPPEQIKPTCDEAMAAVLALADSLISGS